MTTEFTFSSAIRGFHVYRHSWIPHVGEQLEAEREPNNTLRVAVARAHGVRSSARARLFVTPT